MSNSSRVAAAVVLLLALGGCKSLKQGALEKFGTEFSCPEERVKVVARTDLRPFEAMFEPDTSSKPPAEVQADPARLEKWKEDHERQNARAASFYDDRFEMFEVSGCDHVVVYGCSHPGGRGGIALDRVTCDAAKNATPLGDRQAR